MKMHVEYDDFGEYLEAYDGEYFWVAEELTDGENAELTMPVEGAA